MTNLDVMALQFFFCCLFVLLENKPEKGAQDDGVATLKT